jgi:hypothetical protein
MAARHRRLAYLHGSLSRNAFWGCQRIGLIGELTPNSLDGVVLIYRKLV